MLDRIHKVSEIVAAFALVASLVFVGVQISQNTDATRVSNAQVAFQTWSEQGMAAATSESLAEVMANSMYPQARATFSGDVDLVRFQHYQSAVLKTNEVLFLQWRDGYLSDEVWNGHRSTLIIMFATYEGLNQLWGQLKNTYVPDFATYMDSLQAEGAKLRDRGYVNITGH